MKICLLRHSSSTLKGHVDSSIQQAYDYDDNGEVISIAHNAVSVNDNY